MKDSKKNAATRTRETNANLLRLSILPKAGRLTETTGEIKFPCVPGLLDHYVKSLLTTWETLGRPFSQAETNRLREILKEKLDQGFAESQYARLIVKYNTVPPPHPGLDYFVSVGVADIQSTYKSWVDHREGPLFGAQPDAKVMRLAAELGAPAEVPVLDVGAGTGRNTLPLSRAGFPTDAIELTPALCEVLRKEVQKQNLPIKVFEGDVLDMNVPLPTAHYKLIVLAEVVASHFRDVAQVRALTRRAAELLVPGGVLLYSAFVASDGWKPDELSRQYSQLCWCPIFTRTELDDLTLDFPFEKFSDESVHDYEKQHLKPEQWPPTVWFVKWSLGSDVFALPAGRAPMELRWLAYRRR
jgi:SAM-dependent methyltransferase